MLFDLAFNAVAALAIVIGALWAVHNTFVE